MDGSAWSYLAQVAQGQYQINTEQYLRLHLEAFQVPVRRFPPVSFLSHCGGAESFWFSVSGAVCEAQVWLKAFEAMKIFLRPPESKSNKDDVEMEVNADEMMESLRKRIEEKSGLDCYKLKVNGKTVKDDETLRQHKVEDGGIVHTEPEFHGQYLPMGVQPSMEKKRKAEEELEKVLELAPEVKKAAAQAASENVTMAEVNWCGIRAGAYGEKGMRRQMEDETLLCPSLRDLVPQLAEERDFALFGIFDGHGGKQVVEFVKTFLAPELASAYANDEPKEGPMTETRPARVAESEGFLDLQVPLL